MQKSRRAIAAVRRSGLGICLVSGGVLAFYSQAQANITITPTYQSSITGDPNAATIEATIGTAISNIEQYVANPVNVSISFGETSGGLGESESFLYEPTYSQYLGQLQSAQTLSADDTAALATLPAGPGNPVNGNTGILATGPLLRALGFGANPPAGNPDTTILFNAAIVYDSRSSPVFGEYDLQSVVAHEIDEALGIGGTGSELGSGTTGPVGPLDLFRYSAAGTRSFSQSNAVSSYFSIDGGNTDFVHFNQNGAVDGSDFSDWGDGVVPADGQPNTPAQVQDAYGDPYEGNVSQAEPNIGPNELAALDVEGYNLTAAGLALEATISSKVTWTDASGNNLWDNGASANWNNGSSTVTFATSDQVTFNDSNGVAAGRYSVTLNSTVSPASVTVNNSTGNYVISGSGRIAGTGSLSKSGTGTLTLNTVNTYTGGTNVSAGKLIVGITNALPDAAVSITGGTLQLGTSTGLATITSLAISGTGVLDVNNDHLVINYGVGVDPIATVITLIKNGFNHNAWNGTDGIDSSAAAANSASYGLGYADSQDVGNPAALPAGEIEIKYTLLGDANLSGVVDGTDFGILAANFNKGVSRWDQGDFNYDNVVDGTDFGFLAANFNKGASGASVGGSALSDPALVAFAEANGLMADVPEPLCAGMLVLGGAMSLSRRRRSNA